MRNVNEVRCFPLDGWKLTAITKLRYFALPMAAREANRSDLPDVSLSRDFILADRKRARNDRTIAPVTGVGGEMEVLFSHWCPPTRQGIPPDILAVEDRDICSILTGSPAKPARSAKVVAVNIAQ